MAKFRKKPVVIDAFLWTGDHLQIEDPGWIIDGFEDGTVWMSKGAGPEIFLNIKTLEGTMRASQGDYIIRGVRGELYSCKPDIFAATYEPVTEGEK